MYYNSARNSMGPNVKVGRGPRNSCAIIPTTISNNYF
jgi:hypothetical protein